MKFTARNVLVVLVGVLCLYVGVRLPEQLGVAVLCIGAGALLAGFLMLAGGNFANMAILMIAAFALAFILPAVPAYFNYWSPLAMTPDRVGDHNLVPTGNALILLAAIIGAIIFVPKLFGKNKH